MRYYEFASINESATSGSTSSGNIAVVMQPIKHKKALGTGFDPDGDHGIYNIKKIDDKTPLIRRIP